MSKKSKKCISGLLIAIFLFSSISFMQQGVLAQINQTSPKNITAQVAPQGTSSSSLNMSHFTNVANLVINGKTFPNKYNITGGKLLGLVADNDKTAVVAVISPGGSGKMVLTIELPRNVIDSKGQGNTDTKFLVKIDGKGVDYKEVASNLNARILGIDFSKDNRIIEISGTQMTP